MSRPPTEPDDQAGPADDTSLAGSGERRPEAVQDAPGGIVRWAADWIAAIPLRDRLVAITAFLVVAGLIVTGLLARGIVGQYLVGQVDDQLKLKAPALVSVAPSLQSANGLPSDYYVEYRYASGNVKPVRTDASVETFGYPDIPDLTYDEVAQRAGQPFTVRAVWGSEEATRWRVYPFVNANTTDVSAPETAFVALPLGKVDAALEILSRTLVLAGLGIVLLGLVLAWLMIGRSLRQLREIETAAASIAAGDLSRRVPAPPPSTEVGSLAESLNSMLAQIETAFSAREASETRMRQFVSDASHELRTPLATIRGYGELYRMGALDGPDGPDGERVADTMNRVEDAARRMGTLVNDLLVLARLDEGRPLAHAPVDVTDLAQEGAQDLHALDPSREVRVVGLGGVDEEDTQPGDAAARGLSGPDRGVAGPVMTEGDGGRLRQVLTNLIGNVAQHTPAGSPAEIAVGRGPDGEAVIEVRDHGPGVTGEHAERMFERFYRADSSRNRSSGGSGLGLAIVAAIVDAHDGAIDVTPTPGGGLTVRVTLPGLEDVRSPAA
ncbi:sensor histidine kinase [Myceligenerans indicum]|uniref:sensor histidine kinase n=1 Tax=Myceligenerans indicum TaxID=2593663 RepID=UPI0027DDD128|nr:HAMP domain-containing sensor histidine kinase [Myceligenerans indicum]